jgi:hypothetical protein
VRVGVGSLFSHNYQRTNVTYSTHAYINHSLCRPLPPFRSWSVRSTGALSVLASNRRAIGPNKPMSACAGTSIWPLRLKNVARFPPCRLWASTEISPVNSCGTWRANFAMDSTRGPRPIGCLTCPTTPVGEEIKARCFFWPHWEHGTWGERNLSVALINGERRTALRITFVRRRRCFRGPQPCELFVVLVIPAVVASSYIPSIKSFADHNQVARGIAYR